MKFTKELLEKAKNTKSTEELLTLAKENGIELSEEEAAKYFAELNKEGELADEELNNVAGGACYSSGVWGPNGYQKYAVVSPLCEGGKDCADKIGYNRDVDDNNRFPSYCCDCTQYFTAGGICYCAARWEGHDPLE